MKLLIRNARVIDPLNNIDENMDVFIKNGLIKEIREIKSKADEEIDASGLVLCPGFVDIHVHFRSPGFEHKEDYKTGSYAAAAGGFTTVVTMANTKPVIDNEEHIRLALERAKKKSIIRVLPAGAITKEFKGKVLVEAVQMINSGAVAFSEDGQSVLDEKLMIDILEISRDYNFPVICHCEDPEFEQGIVNQGEISGKLGVRGIPSEVEERIVKREIELAQKTGGNVHLTHNSTAGSVDLIRKAKASGVEITCDVTPHHFSLDETFLKNGNTNFKMNPPLRNAKDVSAVIEGIIDGTIDCIATDHAPHAPGEKNQPIETAPFGIIGLETALSVGITYLVEPGHISLSKLVDMLSIKPAQIMCFKPGGIKPGANADLTIFSPKDKKVIDETHIKSKSKNSPYLGMELTGDIKYTIYDGKIIYNRGEIIG